MNDKPDFKIGDKVYYFFNPAQKEDYERGAMVEHHEAVITREPWILYDRWVVRIKPWFSKSDTLYTTEAIIKIQ